MAKVNQKVSPNLLAIVPPYATNCPPAGVASLLGYLKANGCRDFDFLDLRLGVPDAYAPTYSHTGAFGESYVMDIPDLPLALRLFRSWPDAGMDSSAFDGLFERYCLERGISPDFLEGYVRGLDRYLELELARIPEIDFIGFSVWTSNYFSTLLAAAHLKRRRRPPAIVVGGPQVTESRAAALLGLRGGLFDAVALGEGEETLLSLYESFDRSSRTIAVGVPGALQLDSKGRPVEERQALIRLESLPLASFDEMHLAAYQEDEYRAVPFQLSRGCTDKCSFCSEWVFWQHFRLDTPEHAVEQVKELQARYGTDYLLFSDSLLNGHPKRLQAFAEELLRQSVEVEWSGFMRAQMDRRTARLLKKAGCHDVFLGIESFDDRTLELMNKRRTELDNVLAIRAFLESGIGVTAGFIPGFPGDSREGFMHSASMLRAFLREFPGLLSVNEEPFIVSPGQPLYSDLESLNLVGERWDDAYLDICPEHLDVTGGIWCTVSGDGQGLERMGRLCVAGTLEQSTAKNSGFFSYREVEDLTTDGFDFTHLGGDWHLARIKTAAAAIYGAIVDELELETLEELQESEKLAGLAEPEVAKALRKIERDHLVRPVEAPRATKGLHARRISGDCELALSPFVVARMTGWRTSYQLLLANILDGSALWRSRADAELLAYLARKPRRVDSIYRYRATQKTPRGRNRVEAVLDELVQGGVLIFAAVPRADAEFVAGSPRAAQFEQSDWRHLPGNSTVGRLPILSGGA